MSDTYFLSKIQETPEPITILYTLLNSNPLLEGAKYSLLNAHSFNDSSSQMFSESPDTGHPVTDRYVIVLQVHIDTEPLSHIYQRCKKLLAGKYDYKGSERSIFQCDCFGSNNEKYNGIKISKSVIEGQDYAMPEKRPWYDEVANIIKKYDAPFLQQVEWVYNEQGQKYKNPLLYGERLHSTYGPETAHITLSFPWKWDAKELFLTEKNMNYIMSFFE